MRLSSTPDYKTTVNANLKAGGEVHLNLICVLAKMLWAPLESGLQVAANSSLVRRGISASGLGTTR